MAQKDATVIAGPERIAEVFAAFLRLGLTSFGGPIAHLGYFREEFVTRRRWLDDAAYADLVALCQFLPGPASSQVGFALGLMRAGGWGALAAFVAFTLPSALLLVLVALGAGMVVGPFGSGVIDGLKIVAVAIVAQAVLGMARNLCPDAPRAGIALAAVVVLAFITGPWAMVLAIGVGAVLGVMIRADEGGMPETTAPLAMSVPRVVGIGAGAVFIVLFLALPLVAGYGQTLAVIDAFFRAGSLVFGGGHVVLPLLESETVGAGWLGADTFLAGYGAAQAVPGPLFTFAGYLGASLDTVPNGWIGAGLALSAIFLPGFLLLLAVLPFWDQFRTLAPARALMRGANAAVVGILGAALYDPVFTNGVGDQRDFALALGCFLLLTVWRVSPVAVVLVGGLGGGLLALTA